MFLLVVLVVYAFTKYSLVSDIQVESLFDGKLNSCAVDRAVRVVDFDPTSDNLVGQEDILVENRAHRRGALVEAAAGRYLRSLRLSVPLLKGNGGFSDD